MVDLGMKLWRNTTGNEIVRGSNRFQPFFAKLGSSIPSATRIQFFNTASLDFMCSTSFLLNNPGSATLSQQFTSLNSENFKKRLETEFGQK